MMTMSDYMTPTCGAPQRQRAPTRNGPLMDFDTVTTDTPRGHRNPRGF